MQNNDVSNLTENVEETKETTDKNMGVNHAAIAIHNVMKDLGIVEKTGYNTFQKYDYASEFDLITAVRKPMIAHGLIMYPSKIDVVPNTPNDRTDLIIEYTFQHAATGDKLVIPVIGSGQDKTDKAAYKALTGALKYVIRQTFAIATGDDPEATTDSGQSTAPNTQFQKVVDAAKKSNINLVSGAEYKEMWKKLKIDPKNPGQYSNDNEFVQKLVRMVKNIRDGAKSEKEAIQDFLQESGV